MPPRRSTAKPLPDIVTQFLNLTVPLGPVTVRPMFGGHGFYFEGRIFALQAFGEIWLKVDAETKAAFAAADSRPFVYDGKGKPVEMPYWLMPSEAKAGGAVFRRWAGLALEAARRAGSKKHTPQNRRRDPDRED